MTKDPAGCFDGGQKVHLHCAILVAFKVNDLLVRAVTVVREMNGGRTNRFASWILGTGTVRVNVDGTRVKHYRPVLLLSVKIQLAGILRTCMFVVYSMMGGGPQLARVESLI
jgi:hypothetical protein